MKTRYTNGVRCGLWECHATEKHVVNTQSSYLKAAFSEQITFVVSKFRRKTVTTVLFTGTSFC
jgi:hypothetical protein